MRKAILVLAGMASTVIITIVACNGGQERTQNNPGSISKDSAIKRGEYLVNAIGCEDCHSPKSFGPNGPEIIPELRFSGFPHEGQLPPVDTSEVAKGWAMFSPDFTSAVGPWGASFAGNISSDETGIGNWTEENFLVAIRKGKLKGLESSRDLLPPMPWFVYKNLNDEDLRSIFAYLKTTKPVENVVPAPKQLSELK